MNLHQLLFTIDSKFKGSSILNYESNELFSKLLEFSNNALISYIEEYPHLVNRVLIVKNNIKLPNEIKGRVYLISNFIKQYLNTYEN